MNIGHAIAWFFGGAFLMNALPHVVSGSLGRQFQTPFAKPSGIGLSSSSINMLWGFFNLAVAWALLARNGGFDLGAWDHALATGGGAFLMGLFHARHFGRLHGGHAPQ
jgi:hypothetical protein